MPISVIKKIFSSEKGSSANSCMIIAEDKDMVKNLSLYLTHMKYEVRSADSMLSAVKLLVKKNAVKCIFVTAKLNGQNAISQIKELRSERKYAKIPVIFICEKVRENELNVLKENLEKVSAICAPFNTGKIAEAIRDAAGISSDSKRGRKVKA